MIENIGPGYAAGIGGTVKRDDGTWAAWLSLGDGNGLMGHGASEGGAQASLESKIKALGSACCAGLEQAEATYKVATRAKEQDMVNDLKKALGLSSRLGMAAPAKKSDDGGN